MAKKYTSELILSVRSKLNTTKPLLKDTRYLRYLAVILYARNSNFIKEHAKIVKKTPYFNINALSNIGKFIGLKIDRTKVFRIVFEDAESKQEVKKFRDTDGVEYYTLTQKGVESVISKLVEFNAIVNSDYFEEAISGTSAMPTLSYVTPDTISRNSYVNPNVAELLDRIKKISRDLDIE